MHSNNSEDILELRYALDELSIELCLENHKKNDYSELSEIVEAMEDVPSIEDYFKLDRAFHTTISKLSGNQLLHVVNLMIWTLLEHCPLNEYYSEDIKHKVTKLKKSINQ